MTFNRRERKKLYKAAIEQWGYKTQLGMLMEECAELIQAAHKIIRGTEEWYKLAQEMADVEIMIEQIKFMTDWQILETRVESAKNFKLRRLQERLKK